MYIQFVLVCYVNGLLIEMITLPSRSRVTVRVALAWVPVIFSTRHV